MNLLINGSIIQIPKNVNTIAEVIQYFFTDKPVIIVEHNGEILNKDVHSTREVGDGDKLELVHFVGGG
ncbi:sulfur carrier protein ThiS [Bacillus aquiflavi]|uniref:Sulfur carrier protein ThiS n=1 Tax=Bacillus aquiflavi TaxID=2672567 RepID=A0A6B3W1V7_9BACI|nr:sulfur carrier protein ThiS [Bacillus aquiflavi]MBA4537267.1 sulfur carrier protein ThiS [Bacillus aquiflavi]NEY81524.1 sulfur carrier protein ThiS [Bacillus aquiflavi]UAC49470.1 sulfur carrier protein ThiS [Bacillus aquiflavi]